MKNLKGSDKEISYANSIRDSKLGELKDLKLKVYEEEQRAQVRKLALSIIDEYLGIDDARSWIDLRFLNFNYEWLNNKLKTRFCKWK